MIRPGSDNSDPLQDGSCEDLGFHSIEYEDFKVEFECISKQKGRYIFLACLNVTKPSDLYRSLFHFYPLDLILSTDPVLFRPAAGG